MPRVPFDQLPDTGRIWVFASGRPLDRDAAASLLQEVDAFLDQWAAHGKPLRSARDWRDDRFLVIGIDPTHEQASGCSIDGLFHGLQRMERALATELVAGGRVFYRDGSGKAQITTRNEIRTLAAAGTLRGDTPVFDTTVTTARDYRAGFERPARDTWVSSLLGGQASQASSRPATNSSSARNG